MTTSRRPPKGALLIFTTFLMPQVASANAGTPLMWASVFHLTLGNLVIGLGEALLLARLTSAPLGKAIITLILGNYTSAFVGAFLIFPGIVLIDETGYRLQWLLLSGLTAFFATLVVEYPLFKLALQPTQSDPNDIWKRVIQINVISYVFILLGYGAVAHTPFVRFILKLV